MSVQKNSFSVQVCGNTCPHVEDSRIKHRLHAIFSQQRKGAVCANDYRPKVETAEQIQIREKAQQKTRLVQTANPNTNDFYARRTAEIRSSTKQESHSNLKVWSSSTETKEVVFIKGKLIILEDNEKEQKPVLSNDDRIEEVMFVYSKGRPKTVFSANPNFLI